MRSFDHGPDVQRMPDDFGLSFTSRPLASICSKKNSGTQAFQQFSLRNLPEIMRDTLQQHSSIERFGSVLVLDSC